MLVKSSPEDERLELVFTRDPGEAQPIVGLYSPFLGRSQIEIPPGCRLINFHELLEENDTNRRRRSYESLVNHEIDSILRAKDTFFPGHILTLLLQEPLSTSKC
jgi:hypothetical protein